jgi:hypothetical protein
MIFLNLYRTVIYDFSTHFNNFPSLTRGSFVLMCRLKIFSVCSGAEGDFDSLSSTYKKLLIFMEGAMKETQLGLFISRRAPKLINQATGCTYSPAYYKYLIYELLYLWNALPSCSNESLHSILLG